MSSLPMFAAWMVFFLLARELAARNLFPGDWRCHWLGASVAWAVVLTWMVEVASLSRMVIRPVLFLGWFFAAVIVGLSWFRLRQARVGRLSLTGGRVAESENSPSLAVSSFQSFVSEKLSGLRDIPWDGWLVGVGLVGLVALLGVIAATTANTNSDSLTYHLPRVMHWIQERSVDFYPTNNCRQNEFGPWSSYVFLQFHLLAGHDHWDNLLQWFALLTVAIGVSYLADLFLGRECRQVRWRVATLAAALVLSLPNAVAEAVSTQNDLVTACWIMCAMVMAFLLWQGPQAMGYAVGLGLALGLGVLTKASTYFLAIPVVGITGWLFWRCRAQPLARRSLVWVVVAFLAVCGPFWVRNCSLTGSPVSCAKLMAMERNRTVTVSGTASNVLRNLSLHANTGLEPLTRALQRGISVLHRLTGRDMSDPDLTYDEYPFSFKTRFYVFDSYGSGFYHLALLALAGVITVFQPRWRRPFWLCVSGVALSFVVFCALLRWQVWHTRVHLALFMMLAPIVAVVLGSALRHRYLYVGLPLVALGFLCVFINGSRPFFNPAFRRLPREQQYGAIHGQILYLPMREAATQIVRFGCRHLGLKLQFDDLEYPMWMILRKTGFTGRIDHLLVEDISGKIPTDAPVPEAMLTTFKRSPPEYVKRQFPYHTDYGMFRVYWSHAPPETSAAGAVP